jgi:hypothetical protein
MRVLIILTSYRSLTVGYNPYYYYNRSLYRIPSSYRDVNITQPLAGLHVETAHNPNYSRSLPISTSHSSPKPDPQCQLVHHPSISGSNPNSSYITHYIRNDVTA